ncbi:hypothetical protein SAMN05444003_1657 [Cognatiyoonia sediminum]|uniref:Uncharacterized protein n=1 Tax=Cognatiyoonia sediminum TaxID=1508389 RepID=A0A1M5PJ54_9RHOB|nr:hypothetical protein [Cognatiyoonia sediminum]SHH01519.1 hypothetical protein SAMN05444003_1657 [Cognatiyoonia sediminum]
MRFLLAISIAFFLSTTTGKSETPLTEMRISDLISTCAEIIERDGDVAIYARELFSRSRFNVGVQNEENGKRCLETAFGGAFKFEDGRFVPGKYNDLEAGRQETLRGRFCELKDLIEETAQTIKLAKDAEQDRRAETLNATIEACNEWFVTDEIGAITNDVCNSIFTSGGLPNSEIAGPTASELLLAQLINRSAIIELETLTEPDLIPLMAIAEFDASTKLGNDNFDCQ